MADTQVPSKERTAEPQFMRAYAFYLRNPARENGLSQSYLDSLADELEAAANEIEQGRNPPELRRWKIEPAPFDGVDFKVSESGEWVRWEDMRPYFRTAHEPPVGCEQCSNVAPIAKIMVADGFVSWGRLYAPGLPNGQHDLYPSASTPPPEDSERLDFIAAEYLHVVPFDMPTGGGDADVGWRVLQSHQGKGDVEIAAAHRDDLREAIDAARTALTKLPECQHDKSKPRPTLVPLGSAAFGSSDWTWMCTVCEDRFNLPTATAQGEEV